MDRLPSLVEQSIQLARQKIKEEYEAKYQDRIKLLPAAPPKRKESEDEDYYTEIGSESKDKVQDTLQGIEKANENA